VISEYAMLMTKAEMLAPKNEGKPAISAAASAGMICSGSVSGSSWVTAAARMPSAPASSEDSSVLPPWSPGRTWSTCRPPTARW
jgi:hypothetical protein